MKNTNEPIPTYGETPQTRPNPVPEASQDSGHPFPQYHYVPGAPLTHLTGGAKFGWAVTAFLLGPVAILLAWLVNLTAHGQARNDAIKYAVIGFVAQFVIGLLVMTFFGMTACAALGALDPASLMMYY